MSGKVVLITGGANGIGAATGAELARRGWVPVAADIDVGTIHPTWIDTEMVREGEREQPAFDRLRAALRPWFRKTYPLDRAAREIADGFDRRARRICTLGFVRSAHVLRAASTTRLFERDLVKAVPDMERIFEDQVAEHGALHCSLGERERRRIGANVP